MEKIKTKYFSSDEFIMKIDVKMLHFLMNLHQGGLKDGETSVDRTMMDV